jgi:hypothetical protein
MYQHTNGYASPYARVAEKLVDQGFSAIPIAPGKKKPAIMAWTEYCDHLPDADDVRSAVEHPAAFGVGVALGCNGVIAVDVDKDEIVEAIASVLPESPVAKRGRAGCTWFYRASAAVKTKAFDIGGERVLDLLARGRQTVIPPSIHPGTGREYEWIGDPLERFTPESLPLAPDDIAERIAEALRPFGYEPEAVSDRVSVSSGDGWWRETNEVALANLDRWVPALGIGRENVLRKRNGDYRLKAVWRNGDGDNVGVTPKGIRDFVKNKGYSAPGLVMEIKGWDFSTAESWLRDKLGLRDPERIKLIFRKSDGSDPVVLERVGPEDPVMVAAAEMARAEAGDEAWAAHSEKALRSAGDNL